MHRPCPKYATDRPRNTNQTTGDILYDNTGGQLTSYHFPFLPADVRHCAFTMIDYQLVRLAGVGIGPQGRCESVNRLVTRLGIFGKEAWSAGELWELHRDGLPQRTAGDGFCSCNHRLPGQKRPIEGCLPS